MEPHMLQVVGGILVSFIIFLVSILFIRWVVGTRKILDRLDRIEDLLKELKRPEEHLEPEERKEPKL